MGEVVILGGLTNLPIPMERVLDANKDLQTVLVLGWNDSSKRFTLAITAAISLR